MLRYAKHSATEFCIRLRRLNTGLPRIAQMTQMILVLSFAMKNIRVLCVIYGKKRLSAAKYSWQPITFVEN
jgi:hypothetical protein